MDTVQLGQTGISVSRLGLGTVKFGRNEAVKYPEGFEIPTEEALASLLDLAKSLGVNTLDTAPAYGTSEERLGRLLKGQREEWVIVGKAGEEFVEGRSTYIFTPDHFKMSLERSLSRLQTNYLDIFLIHSNGQDMDILENDALIRTMHDMKDQGMVRAIGASTKTVAGGCKTLDVMDVVMCAYNPTYTDEEEVLAYAHTLGKGAFIKKALASGYALNPSESLRFALGHPGASAAIVGTITPDHLVKNVEAVKKIQA